MSPLRPDGEVPDGHERHGQLCVTHLAVATPYHTGFPSLSRVIQALLFVALRSAQNAGAAGCSQRGSRRSRLEISGCRPLLAARRCQSVALQRTQGAGEVRANYLDVRPVIAGDNAVVFATLI